LSTTAETAPMATATSRGSVMSDDRPAGRVAGRGLADVGDKTGMEDVRCMWMDVGRLRSKRGALDVEVEVDGCRLMCVRGRWRV
jgi:hypothetical protein